LSGRSTEAPFLVYTDDSGSPRFVALDQAAPVVVGRAGDAQVRLDWDADVSRVHACIEGVGGAWTLLDDGLSRNGTYLNGDRIRGRARLRDGDVIRVGQTSLTFRAPPDELPTTTAGTQSSAPALSQAQRSVLVALCRPLQASAAGASPATNQEIADELFLSVETIKDHMKSLYAKFGVAGLPQPRKRPALAERAFATAAVRPADFELR
jgi:pSer/pThr/pTyr-binding forkhead associated (FHA) protein